MYIHRDIIYIYGHVQDKRCSGKMKRGTDIAYTLHMHTFLVWCMHACVRACVRACVHACVRATRITYLARKQEKGGGAGRGGERQTNLRNCRG